MEVGRKHWLANRSKRPKKVNTCLQKSAIKFDWRLRKIFMLQFQARTLITSSRAVLSSREVYRLSVLRFQAGVGTQRQVIDNQRDVTTAEVTYTDTIADYNTTLAELRRPNRS